MTSIPLRMAKASKEDIDAAYALANAFQTIGYGYDPCVEDGDRIDIDDGETCRRILAHLIAVADRGSLFRVAGGLGVLLDPQNEVVDPNVGHIELHPRFAAAAGGGR